MLSLKMESSDTVQVRLWYDAVWETQDLTLLEQTLYN